MRRPPRTRPWLRRKAIFYLRRQDGGRRHNPCLGIERNPARSRDRFLSDDEIKLLWGDLDVPFRLILLTGARPGEIFSMRAEDVRDGTWTQPGAPDGTGRGEELADAHRSAVRGGGGSRRRTPRSPAQPPRLRGPAQEALAPARDRDGSAARPSPNPRDARGAARLRPAGDRASLEPRRQERSPPSTTTNINTRAEDRRLADAVARHIVAIVEGRAEDNVVRLR